MNSIDSIWHLDHANEMQNHRKNNIRLLSKLFHLVSMTRFKLQEKQ